MESQTKITAEKYNIKSKIKEYIDEANIIFESKARQMNSIINSIKIDHNRLLSKSKLKKCYYFYKIK
jgi:hypothetical protein